LNWNGWEDTLACLDSLAGLRRAEGLSVVVCDNGSTDGSCDRILAWAAERFPPDDVADLADGADGADARAVLARFVLVRNGANRGFAAGNNPGIRLALARGAEFVWLLNNDCAAEPDALAALLDCAGTAERPGILGSTVVYRDSGTVQCAGGCVYNPATTVFRYVGHGLPLDRVLARPEPARLDYVYGASMFVRGEVFAIAGLLCEDYFLFYEELDLCARARRAGFGLAWCPGSVVRHAAGASVGRAGRGNGELACYHENLSTLVYTARFHPGLLPLAAAVRLAGKLAALCRRREFRLVGPLLRAYGAFALRLAGRACGGNLTDQK
jgi:GT2 family glycosyltransferase